MHKSKLITVKIGSMRFEKIHSEQANARTKSQKKNQTRKNTTQNKTN